MDHSPEAKGTTTSHVAQTVDVSTRRVKKLWARYKHTDTGKILYPARMGRPENGLPGRREYSVVPFVRYREHLEAAGMQDGIMDSTGINISHSTIHKIERQISGIRAAKEEPETEVCLLRAHLLQLHVAHRLQTAGRQQVVSVLRQ